MNKSTLLCLAALAACAILNAKGYEAYTYDISALKEDTYRLKFEIREYVSGVETEDKQRTEYMKLQKR